MTAVAHAAEKPLSPKAKPEDQEQAILAATAPIPRVNSFQLWATYVDIRQGGDAIVFNLRIDLRWQYVLVPGLKIPNMTTVVRFDQRFASLHTPKVSAT